MRAAQLLGDREHTEIASIRPPLGYQLKVLPGPGQGQVYAWVGPRRVDGTAHQLMIITVAAEAGGGQDVLGTFLLALRERRSGWRQGETERWSVDDVDFRGATWRAIETGTSISLEGFLFVGRHDGRVVALMSQDVATQAGETLSLARQSFETLRLERRPQP